MRSPFSREHKSPTRIKLWRIDYHPTILNPCLTSLNTVTELAERFRTRSFLVELVPKRWCIPSGVRSSWVINSQCLGTLLNLHDDTTPVNTGRVRTLQAIGRDYALLTSESQMIISIDHVDTAKVGFSIQVVVV